MVTILIGMVVRRWGPQLVSSAEIDHWITKRVVRDCSSSGFTTEQSRT